jgi:hypothetical protein
MHQTNHRGHNETSTATTQNQLAYKACHRWRELSTRLDAIKHIGVQHINEYAALDIAVSSLVVCSTVGGFVPIGVEV